MDRLVVELLLIIVVVLGASVIINAMSSMVHEPPPTLVSAKIVLVAENVNYGGETGDFYNLLVTVNSAGTSTCSIVLYSAKSSVTGTTIAYPVWSTSIRLAPGRNEYVFDVLVPYSLEDNGVAVQPYYFVVALECGGMRQAIAPVIASL